MHIDQRQPSRLARMRRALGRVLRPDPESKASASGPLIAIEGLGAPAWMPRDYAAFAREGMMQNAVVYRSVRMIAEAAASVPLLLYAGDEEIDAHPLSELLARPSPGKTSSDLLEAWYGFLLVAGNAYLEAVAAGGRLRELHALRPDRMRVVPGADGWPEAFEYSVAGHTHRFAGEAVPGVPSILHVKLFHPANDHYGLSPLEAAATAIDIHNTASRWNKALLDNSARPSGALIYSSGAHLTGEQFERLKAELETSFQGARNAGRPLLLEGGLDWRAMSLSPRDLDFIDAKHAAAREIALALGVPPMLLGIPGDNTYANYQEANRTFWRQTVLPLVNRTARSLSAWLAPAWGEPLVLRPDLDAIEALSAEREALWARLERASFLTVDEKRAAVGYGPVEGGEGQAGEKFNPHHDELDRFTTADGAVAADSLVHDVVRRRPGQGGTPAQELRLDAATQRAREAVTRLRELDPYWRPPQSMSMSIEGAIRHQEATAEQAEARLAEILRDAIPNTNPSWGVNRLRKELNELGYVFEKSTRAAGYQYYNPQTRETVRIMKRPPRAFRTDSPQKHHHDYYYRYKPPGGRWGAHITIPDK